MIEPKLGSDGKRLPSSTTLGERQKDFFFHTDVAEKPGPKWSVRFLIHPVGMGHSLLKQCFESPVVFYKKVCDRSRLFVLARIHPLPPTMSSDSLCLLSCWRRRCHPLVLRGRGCSRYALTRNSRTVENSLIDSTSICTGYPRPNKNGCANQNIGGGDVERWCRRRHHESSG